MKPADVEIPRRMRGLMRDARGYPVPFIVQRDKRGRPNFAINDSARVQRSIEQNRCAICGNHLDAVRWLVGGPLSAFHPHGAYVDSALHHDCMEYALRVCPYLAAPVYMGDINKRLDVEQFADGLKFQDPIGVNTLAVPGRPQLFVAVGAWQIKRLAVDGGHDHSRPVRPFHSVEYWLHGEKLSEQRGRELATAAVTAMVER